MLHIYKPTPKLTGCACSFNLSEKDSCFFIQFIKQKTWNEKTRVGSFEKDDPTKKASGKFAALEITGIIDALESDREYSGFHSSENQTVRFAVKPYVDKAGIRVGFSFYFSKEEKEDSTKKLSFVIGLKFNEARRIVQHLLFLLDKLDQSQEKTSSYRPEESAGEKPQYAKKPQYVEKRATAPGPQAPSLPTNSPAEDDGEIW